MSQVSCRATASVLEVLTRWGVDIEPIVDGGDFTADKLADVGARIDWDTFARFLERVSEALDHDDKRLEAVGEDLFEVQSWPLLRELAERFISPRAIARMTSLMGSAMFPTMDFEQRFSDDGRMELSLSIPSHRRAARPFFLITLGQWRALPRALGLPDAEIEADIGDHHGRYVVTFPPRRVSPWRDLVGAALATPTWLRSVHASRRELRESFGAMERWRRDFHRVLDHLPDAVLIHREGKVAYANQTLVRLLSDDDDDLVGRRVEHVVSWEAFCRACAACRAGTEQDEERRVEINGPIGRHVLELRLVQGVDFNGERAELIVGQDITGRLDLEERLLHTDRMATLGSLAAGMAHEINNPLGYLLNSLQILQRDAASLEVGGTVDASWLERLRAMLDVALEGTERVRTILDDLRTFVRRDDDQARPTSVRDAVEYSLEILGGELSGVTIECDFSSEALHVSSPPSRVSQVVVNLMLNAVQALRSDGGGKVTLRTRRRGDHHCEIEIADDGPGMTEEVRAQAFEPFFTTKPAGVGTGLGLPICRELAHRLGGTLELESQVGKGTRVRVCLPLVDPGSVTSSPT